MRFVLSRCYVFQDYMSSPGDGERILARAPNLVHIVTKVSLSTPCHLGRAFTFAECSGRIRNEDDRAVAYYVYSYVARSGAERSICDTKQ